MKTPQLLILLKMAFCTFGDIYYRDNSALSYYFLIHFCVMYSLNIFIRLIQKPTQFFYIRIRLPRFFSSGFWNKEVQEHLL